MEKTKKEDICVHGGKMELACVCELVSYVGPNINMARI
jgi:hypothetical protein